MFLFGRATGVGSVWLIPAFVAVLGLSAAWAGHLVANQPQASAVPPEPQAREIFQALHRGIYRAFEAETEGEIYDTLAQSLDGEALQDVYGEVYDALMMRDGGNKRFDIRRVKPISTEVLPAEEGERPAFRVRCRWRVYGTVTHYGHTHARLNEYEALYRVTYTGRAWRITDSQVQQHERVSIGRT